MIVEDKKCVFLHIPKCAGSSIEKALGDIPTEELHAKNNGEFKYKINYQHAFPDEIPNLDQYWSFCFVRNPWDRMVSYYEHMRRLNLFGKQHTFGAFVRGLEDDFKKISFRRPHPARYFAMPAHTWAQKADYVGKFESIHTDWKVIASKFSLPKLTHINQSKHINYAFYYDETTIDIVRNYYAIDIDKYGYKYEGIQ